MTTIGAKDYWLNRYVKYVPGTNDYHDVRYARIYDFIPETMTLKGISWYDAFVGYENVTIPVATVLEVKDKFTGISVPNDCMPNTGDVYEL